MSKKATKQTKVKTVKTQDTYEALLAEAKAFLKELEANASPKDKLSDRLYKLADKLSDQSQDLTDLADRLAY